MILIKIDRDSIEENPNYGNNVKNINGKKEIIVTITGPVPNYLIDKVNCYLVEYSIDKGKVFFRYYLKDDSLVEQLQKEPFVNVDITSEVIQIPSHEPQYLYNYKGTLIECENCHESFLHNELEFDEKEDDTIYTFTKCPKCGEWDCADITFEDISTVINKI